MENTEEYRFIIEAYTPETMPLARLAEYLAELAKILGETRQVHFLRLEKGSTIAVQAIEKEAVPKVVKRTQAIKRGDAPREAMRAYEKMNSMLKEDNGSGSLTNATSAEIIQFPGRKASVPEFTSVRQSGDIDGKVVRIGGMGDPVPILLEVEGVQLSGCSAARRIAKPLATRLFEPVRLFGEGYWSRSDSGDWKLDKFNVNHFEPLHDEPLSAEVMALRGLRGDNWGSNPIEDILRLRYDEGEA